MSRPDQMMINRHGMGEETWGSNAIDLLRGVTLIPSYRCVTWLPLDISPTAR